MEISRIPFSLLGQSKQVTDVHKDKSVFLRDPFTSSPIDLVVYCLRELTEALHLTVVHTYYQLPEHKCSRFFLVGYEPRSRWFNYQKKIYDDPERCPEGMEIKWLLKNLRWFWKQYAKYMELNDDAFDDITGFLLFDVVNNAYADPDAHTFLHDDEDDSDSLVLNCFEASLDLIIAVTEATYYETIAEEVAKNRQNLETMMPLISELHHYKSRQHKIQNEPIDTRTVIEFLKSPALLQELEKEDERDGIDNPMERPLTNFFLYTVMPRFDQLALINDSGIESAVCGDTTTHEQFEEVVDESMEHNHLVQSLDETTAADVLLVKSLNDEHVFDSSDMLNVTTGASNRTLMDGSIIVVPNQTAASTPVSASIPRKETYVIPQITEEEDDEAEISSDDNKGEECDGSFILI